MLGWTGDDMAREVEHYRARVEAERESQQQPDDHTADAARLGRARTSGWDLPTDELEAVTV